MHFTFMDENVSITTNVFLIIANIINIIYNVPQMVKTYKTKSTRDFSAWFIGLRIFGNIIWIEYAIEVDSLLMLINNVVTVVASIFIGYYKVIEIYSDNYSNPNKDVIPTKYNSLNNSFEIDDIPDIPDIPDIVFLEQTIGI